MSRLLEKHRRNAVAALGTFCAGSATATTEALAHCDAFDAAVGWVGGFFTAVIPHSGAGPAALEEAREFARRHGTAVLLWTAGSADARIAHECWLAGLERAGAMSGMVLDQPCADTAVETEVVDRDNAQEYLDLQRAQLGAAAQHVARPEVLLRGDVRARIARVEGAPAACGMVVTTGKTAGLYWVWTLEQHRRRGLGEAITRALCRDAFDHGARHVVLQASSQGAPIYGRLGFRPFALIERHVVPPASSRAGEHR